jgi:hypothetical protein
MVGLPAGAAQIDTEGTGNMELGDRGFGVAAIRVVDIDRTSCSASVAGPL